MADMDPRPSLEKLIAGSRDKVATLYKERMPFEDQLRKAAEALLPHARHGSAGIQQHGEALNHGKFNIRDLPLADLRPDAKGFIAAHDHLHILTLKESIKEDGLIQRYVGDGPVGPLRRAIAALEVPQAALTRERRTLEGLCKRAGIDFAAFDRDIHHTVHQRSIGAVIEKLPRVPAMARGLQPAPVVAPAVKAVPVAVEATKAPASVARVFAQPSITGQEHAAREAVGLGKDVPYYIDDVLQQQHHTKLMGRVELANTLEARTARLMAEGEPMFDFISREAPKAPGLRATLREWGRNMIGRVEGMHFTSPFAPVAMQFAHTHAPVPTGPVQLPLPFDAAVVEPIAPSAFMTRSKAALKGSTTLAHTPVPHVPASFIHLTPPEGYVDDGHIVDPFPNKDALNARRTAVVDAREARLARGDSSGFAALSKAEDAAKAAKEMPHMEPPVVAAAVPETEVAVRESKGIAARAGEFFKRFKRSNTVQEISKEAAESRRSSMVLGSVLIGSVVAALAFGSNRESERGGAGFGR